MLYLKVLMQKNFVAKFYQEMSVLFVKRPISVSEPPFGELRGNVCDSFLARWKARSRLSIGYSWTFLLAFTTKELWVKMRRSQPSLKKVGHFEAIYWRATFSTDIYTSLDMEMVLLQHCRWTFHTNKLYSRLYSVELEFYSQKW